MGTLVQEQRSCGMDVRPFHRILMELGAEHRRALEHLRAELEGRSRGECPRCSYSPASTPDIPWEGVSAARPPLGNGREEPILPETGSGTVPESVTFTHSLSKPELCEEQRRTCKEKTSMEKGTLSDQTKKVLTEKGTPIEHTNDSLATHGFWTRADALGSARLSPFDWTSETDLGTKSKSANQQRQQQGKSYHGMRNLTREVHDLFGNDRASARSRTRTSARTDDLQKRACLQRLVKDPVFDTLSCTAIVLNAILLGVIANIQANAAVDGESPDTMPFGAKVLSIAFTAVFSFELILRMSAIGPRRFFCGEDFSWNLFDSLVVGSDLMQVFLEVFSITLPGGVAVQKFTAIRVLRILRITRVVRVVRLVRFFRELRMMVYSLMRSGSSLLWSWVLLSVTIYIFGIYFSQIVAFHLHAQASVTDGPEAQSNQLLREMFGNLLRAQYTLYQAVSGGISWGEIGALLINIDAVHGGVLCFYTFFTTFALLNIITGIFVDSSINGAKSQQEETIEEQMYSTKTALKEIQLLFDSADTDGSGNITLDEFEDLLRDAKVRAHMNAMGIELDKAKGLFRLLDLDDSGEVNIHEFVMGCLRLKGNAKSIDLATLMYENKRMAHRLCRFFAWCEGQFRGVHRLEARVEGLLASLARDDPARGTHSF